MDIVTGALGSVLSKLDEFLKDEYNLQSGVREKITSLSRELESMHATLRKVAEVPPNELHEQVKLWARDVRELSYKVEDILDDFLVRAEAGRKRKDPDMKWYQHVANINDKAKQAKARREISGMIDIINDKAKEVAMGRERYRVDNIVANKPAAKNTVDPRLKLMYFIVIDDIRERQSWETIKLALDGNNCGSRIIITTRKLEVAKEAGAVFKLKPLSYDNSKRLFYTRLFGGEDKCPNNHPDELCDQILKKCGEVPLAIITMASLLLGKSREEWIEVCSSPGFYRDKDDRHMENTMHILSLSYYDLPCHLKTCLLYLSLFPEDSLTDKDSLIWKWIAEGFVEEKPGRGIFEVGEEYFHDLINRSMIQGVDSEVYGVIDGCHVHDMVLDLIVSMSREENFVSDDATLSQSQARWLAPKSRELDLTLDTHVNLPQVRSFIFWRCDILKWALHPRLKLIRLLALEGCKFREGCHSLELIGNLLHLRYLGIRGVEFEKLPEGIGALKFLQILELVCIFGDPELPCSIGMLTRLVCLCAQQISAPDGVIGRLTSLEELQIKGPRDNDESRRQFVKDLGNLCELRVLKIGDS